MTVNLYKLSTSETTFRQSNYFYQLDYRFVDDIARYLQKYTFLRKEFIFHRFDTCDSLIIVLKGQCESRINKVRIGIYSKGTVAGDCAKNTMTMRKFDLVVTSNECVIVRLPKSDYETICDELEYRKASKNFKIITSSSIFNAVPIQHVRKIDALCMEHNYDAGSIITEKDDVDSNFYIVKSGSVNEEIVFVSGSSKNLMDNNNFERKIMNLGKSSCFGVEVILGDAYVSTIIAHEKTTVLILDWNKVQQLFESSPILLKLKENAKSKVRALNRCQKRNSSLGEIRTANLTELRSSFGDSQPPSRISELEKDLLRSFSFKDIPLVEEPKRSKLRKQSKNSNNSSSGYLKTTNNNEIDIHRYNSNISMFTDATDLEQMYFKPKYHVDVNEESCTTVMCCSLQE